MKIDAILWDYDGTLVDSRPKNIDITKQILSRVTPRLTGENLPKYLKSEELYNIANHKSKNWQDLYINYYGMSENEMLEAGKLWSEYQIKNTTPVNLFSEVKLTINQIHLPQGICSQNSAKNINNVLKHNYLIDKFHAIVGYDDIPSNAQKPFPFGGLKCLNLIFESISNKIIFYIGDHEGDVEFARNINKELEGRSNVIAVAVKYSGAETKNWTHKPDYEIERPTELLDLINDYN